MSIRILLDPLGLLHARLLTLSWNWGIFSNGKGLFAGGRCHRDSILSAGFFSFLPSITAKAQKNDWQKESNKCRYGKFLCVFRFVKKLDLFFSGENYQLISFKKENKKPEDH